ncbi:MAG: hypothetical protein HWE20_05705 [Gammaproteobacteria bacterium]|nr:hypothetical protein [Gammaproteobacteria bacterium]
MKPLFVATLLLISNPTLAKACTFFCEAQQVVDVSVMEPNLEDGYVLEICLDRALGRRDRFYPEITLKNRYGQQQTSSFILQNSSTEASTSKCFKRDLLSYADDTSPEAVERWFTAFSPNQLLGITIEFRQKTWTGKLETIQVYEGH